MTRPWVFAAVLAALAGPARAHTGQVASGLAAGLAHLLAGSDHLFAGPAIWLSLALADPGPVPAVAAGFLPGMVLGGLAGLAGLTPGAAEVLMAGSLAGVLMATAARPAIAARGGLVAGRSGLGQLGQAAGAGIGAAGAHPLVGCPIRAAGLTPSLQAAVAAPARARRPLQARRIAAPDRPGAA